MKERIVIILSGGLDSTTLLYNLKNTYNGDIFALSFDYNQKHKKELNMAKWHCKKLNIPHKIINLGILNDIAPSALTRKDWKMPEGDYKDNNMKLTVVPNRNMIMLSLATAYAIGIDANTIYYGAHSGDHTIYPDCRPEFINAMKRVLKICDWKPIMLLAPYQSIDKAGIVEQGIKYNIDYSKTWTCYNGKRLACGKCGSCRERLEAFKKNNIKDPLKYK